MVQFGTLTATTLSSSPKYGSIVSPPLTYPHPDPSQMSADDRKRKLDAIKPSQGRRDPHGSAQNAPSAPQRGMRRRGGQGLARRAGVSKKHGKKDKHGKKKKKKKNKHSRGKKKRDAELRQ